VLRAASDAASAGRVPDRTPEAAVEMLGYLELAFEPAEHVVIVGMNDHAVPGTRSPDPVLTEVVCRTLGIESPILRQARDLAILACSLGWRERITAIAGRTSAEGDPLVPSRLLFMRSDEDVAQELKRFSEGDPRSPTRAAPLAVDTEAGQTPAAYSVIDRTHTHSDTTAPRMSVTGFRGFLKSPYLHFLKREARLRERDASTAELNSMAFGNLVHEILERFVTHGGGDSQDPEVIRAALHQAAAEVTATGYAASANPAVAVQLEMLRHRLDGFVESQARWAADGWRIRHAEWSPPGGGEVVFGHDNEQCRLVGKIDRIDINMRTGEVALLDYKTGGKVGSPEAEHGKPGKWKDLQLPLYRHLAQDIIQDRQVRLGYVTLPRVEPGSRAPGPSIARWTEDDLKDAYSTARSIVRHIRSSQRDLEIGERHPTRGVWHDLAELKRVAGGSL
jgi:RecB family exonuclease